MQHDFVVIPHIVAYTVVVDSVLRLEGLVVDQQRLKPRLSQPLSFVWRQRLVAASWARQTRALGYFPDPRSDR